jgi:hypothetical protein
LIERNILRKKIYKETSNINNARSNDLPRAQLEWVNADFAYEFPITRPRHEIIRIIQSGKNGKLLSGGTLRRMKDWIKSLPQGGGVGATMILAAIDSQLQTRGEKIEDSDFLEKQLEFLQNQSK